MTDFQTQKRKLEEQICKMAYNKSRITNESDVLKWVVRKEFGELRRYLELEESGFMQRIESKAAGLVSSIQSQADDLTTTLAKFQEAEGMLEALSNESHLGFITVGSDVRFRECQQKQQREEKTYNAINFKPAPESLKFDPLTAHPMLDLSLGDTAVECGTLLKRLANNPERFSYSYCVLATRGFSSGKHYWEVFVGDKPKWRLGMIKGTAGRKAKLPKSPESGVWLIGLREGRVYEAFASPRVTLPLVSQPSRIGVFLDYEGGVLRFYNADSPDELEVIYTYNTTLQGKIYPLLDVCWHERGANKHPISLPQTHKEK
ncbi:hypothetical protein DPEC_G00301260 [Dallia pectoralis]|uniref:Uncharacterized protein n=1 Tax=Dallia pectoralis TaxID=75939 RepID=A0ACC2FGV3_DALPE|nr:hypothetical protein DPEC_G00301260 [Dallia pectoralis]